MAEREAWAEAGRAMHSPSPFPLPTFEELGDPSWEPRSGAWPPPGWNSRVLEAMRWPMVVELDGLIARCAAATTAQGGTVPEDDAAER